jgi:tetratricopeptide (TPR) repeat protein
MNTFPPQVARLAHYLMAWILVQEKDFDGSLAEVDEALTLAPYDTFPLCDLTIVLVQAGRPQQALEKANAAIARDPGLGWFCNYAKGWALLTNAQYDQAVETLEQADFLDTPLLLATAYVHQNRISDARAEVAKMLKVNPAITLQSWRQGYSFRDPAVLDRVADDLARAGLPGG